MVPEGDVQGLHGRAGLRITEIRYGDWCGRKTRGAVGQQDVIVAVK